MLQSQVDSMLRMRRTDAQLTQKVQRQHDLQVAEDILHHHPCTQDPLLSKHYCSSPHHCQQPTDQTSICPSHKPRTSSRLWRQSIFQADNARRRLHLYLQRCSNTCQHRIPHTLLLTWRRQCQSICRCHIVSILDRCGRCQRDTD
jgi:hypothetical protein